MAVRHITLRSPRELARALDRLERQVYEEVVQALRDTARYGETAAVQTAHKTSPFKPIAQQTYINAWAVKDLKNGAILGNSAYHSYHVEVGRRPGRRPPLQPIIEWIKAKHFGKPRSESKKGRKRKPKLGFTKPASQGGKKPGAEVKKARVPKVNKGGNFQRRFKRFGRKEDSLRAFAFAVQAKIGRVGYKGKYVLKRTLPKLGKYFRKRAKVGLAKAIRKAR